MHKNLLPYLSAILVLSFGITNVLATTYAFKNPWPLGKTYTDQIEIFGRQVPLPGGTWVVAGVGTDSLAKPYIRAYGVIATLVLFKLEDKQIKAFTLIHANAIPIDGGWGISRDCKRTDLPYAKVYESGELHTFCAYVKPLMTTATASAQELTAWQNAVRLAKQNNWQLPLQWWEAGIRICDWHDILDIRYAFATETLVRYSKAPRLDSTPDAMLIKWIDQVLPAIYLGFKRSLNARVIPQMPGVIKQKLYTTPDNWNNPASQEEMSDMVYSFWKVAINRVINMATSIGVVYLFVGNIYLASGLQFVSSSLHGGVNYVEELLWNTYGPQRLRKAKPYDFNYIGIEGY
ncbi:hypothetical protein TI05_01005 [Achromatium sp. WMS3]|nr:hypothetical protein TI05_01005 [Achromatium sp. WMS3]